MDKIFNEFIKNESSKMYFSNLQKKIENSYSSKVVYPEIKNIFKAFYLTPIEKIKVVLIGQDPYHNPGQAMGLSFSVPTGFKLPPSLRNIYKEIEDDLKVKMDYKNGDLTYLAKQGVLLLNKYLIVEANKPLSLNFPEFETFLINVLSLISLQEQPIVFILWGDKAKSLSKYISNKNHLILSANHPSPMSANRGGFFGCKHFSKANNYLVNHQLVPISWQNT